MGRSGECQQFIGSRVEVAVAGIRYEDIVSSPLHSMQKILAYCELPSSWAAKAITAMERDSMHEMKNNHKQKMIVQKMDIKQLNDYCRKIDIPSLDADFILEGTITQ